MKLLVETKKTNFYLLNFLFRSFYSKTGAYSQSKSAQIMFTKVLDERLSSENKPVKVYAIHPGFIRSNLYTQTWYAKFVTLTMGFMFKVKAITTNSSNNCFGYLTYIIYCRVKNKGPNE